MILNFYRRHKEWFSLFSSAFAGTLLGIGITLAVSTYEERDHQETASLRCLILALEELDDRYNTMESIFREMKASDSVFQEVLDYAPNKLEEMPEELINEFDSKLNSFSVHTSNNIAEHLLLNNIEVLDIFDDLTVLRDLNTLYGMTRYFEEWQGNTYKNVRKMLKDYSKREDYHHISDNHVFVKTFFSNPEVYSILDEYHMVVMLCPPFIETCKQLKMQFQDKMGIDSVDLATIRHSHFEDTEVKKEYVEVDTVDVED